VQLRDRFRQAKTTGGDPLAVEFLGAARGTATGRVIDRGDGKYTVRYLCVTPGTYSLQVSLAGAHISGSPFKITVQASNATNNGTVAAGGPIVGSTWVASLGGRGSKEDQLMNPLGMTVSAEGLFVSDYANARICVFNLQPPHALVRCIGKGGVVPALSPTSAAGSSSDAAASSPSSSLTSLLRNPWSVAVDPLSGELFVSDSGASKILVFASATGEFLRAFGGVVGSSGGGGGGVNGGTNAAGGRFRHPAGLAIYTPPAMLQQHLQQQQQQQGSTATVAPAVTASPLNGVAATPLSPTSSSTLASTLSTQQLLFVCDRDKHRMQCFDLQGRLLRTWGSNGSGAGQFLHPSGVAVSAAPLGNTQQQPLVYVCDSSNHRVQVFTLSGSFVSMFGTRGAAPGQFLDPQGVLVLQTPVPTPPATASSSSSSFTGVDGQAAQNATGTNGISFVTQVLVADQSNHRVQSFSASGSFLRLVGSQAGGRTAERGQLVKPAGLALAAVRKSDGVFVPMTEALMLADTAAATDAKTTVPQTVLFVSDTASHRVQVFK
jgi:hypothetical protein